MKYKFRIFSDGGSDSRGNAAGATIIECGEKVYCTAHYLGTATNNEGEIFSSLAGFAHIAYLYPNNSDAIEWISDSQYALKSATEYIKNWERNGWKTSAKEPVKNQGLWKTFLKLSKGVSFKATHVKGHSGHPENEACDLAVAWARGNSEEFNSKFKGKWLGSVVDIGDDQYSHWNFRDSRDLLALIRQNGDSGITAESFLEELDFSSMPKKLGTSEAKVVTKPIATSLDIDASVKKLSKSYLKKLQELDPKKELLKQKTDFSESIKLMKRWLE